LSQAEGPNAAPAPQVVGSVDLKQPALAQLRAELESSHILDLGIDSLKVRGLDVREIAPEAAKTLEPGHILVFERDTTQSWQWKRFMTVVTDNASREVINQTIAENPGVCISVVVPVAPAVQRTEDRGLTAEGRSDDRSLRSLGRPHPSDARTKDEKIDGIGQRAQGEGQMATGKKQENKDTKKQKEQKAEESKEEKTELKPVVAPQAKETPAPKPDVRDRILENQVDNRQDSVSRDTNTPVAIQAQDVNATKVSPIVADQNEISVRTTQAARGSAKMETGEFIRTIFGAVVLASLGITLGIRGIRHRDKAAYAVGLLTIFGTMGLLLMHMPAPVMPTPASVASIQEPNTVALQQTNAPKISTTKIPATFDNLVAGVEVEINNFEKYAQEVTVMHPGRDEKIPGTVAGVVTHRRAVEKTFDRWQEIDIAVRRPEIKDLAGQPLRLRITLTLSGEERFEDEMLKDIAVIKTSPAPAPADNRTSSLRGAYRPHVPSFRPWIS
jgi:hypothetical protein